VLGISRIGKRCRGSTEFSSDSLLYLEPTLLELLQSTRSMSAAARRALAQELALVADEDAPSAEIHFALGVDCHHVAYDTFPVWLYSGIVTLGRPTST
jgi:hypothetical protein